LEGKDMPSGNEKVLEEMREAEEEIDEDVAEHEGTGRVTANGDVIPLEEIEAGGRRDRGGPEDDVGGDHHAKPKPPPSKAVKGMLEGTRNLCSLLFGPVFVQVFVLTFLGEWGDRSQIATIMLAAAHVSWRSLLSGIRVGAKTNPWALLMQRMYISWHSEQSLDT
jgi:putative Ca2+/H+ antiporter (TMEM165/GDT1 family)